MVFLTVDENRTQLENLTELLVRTYPGSVIYQYTDPIHAVIHMENRQIDVMFANVGVFQKKQLAAAGADAKKTAEAAGFHPVRR